MLRHAIDRINPEQFLNLLEGVDNDRPTPSLKFDQPMFYWIFRNTDFEPWVKPNGSEVLWLSGPPECNITQVSSYMVNLENERALSTGHTVLYFFCSARKKPIMATFVRSLLYQFINNSPMDKQISIIKLFLHDLLRKISKAKEVSDWKIWSAQEKDSPPTKVNALLNVPPENLWGALEVVLTNERDRKLTVVVDGVDKPRDEGPKFISRVRELIELLQEHSSEFRALLTSRPSTEMNDAFDGLHSIEYDKERKG